MNATQNHSMRNENMIDRFLRLLIGLVLFQLGFFWLGGLWQGVVYVLSGVLLLTALTGICPLYKVIGLSTARDEERPLNKVWLSVGLLVLVVVLVGGSYGSSFISRKIFLEDFNQMNSFYKQALFQSGQGNREGAIQNYEQLVVEYGAFQQKYNAYQPYALRGDDRFEADLATVAQTIEGVAGEVYNGDLQQAHVTLEEVRPVFQEIFKRNNFSMLAVALVDFHDVMETALAAAAEKDAQGVLTAYTTADTALKAVEVEANDTEIQTIRANLESLRAAAADNQTETLPDLADQLKSSFVKVYLKRG